MSNVIKIFFIIVCLFNTNIWADVAANKGDIRIFISPQAMVPIKLRLLLRTSNQMSIIANETPTLMPAQYYTFDKITLKNYSLNNQTIYIQLYNSIQKKWMPSVVLINHYNDSTSPFYQFSCWFEGTSIQPLCWGEEQG